MNKLTLSLAVTMALAFALPATAQVQVPEREQNPIDLPQDLATTSSDVLVDAALGNGAANDLDFFVINATNGDTISAAIQSGGALKTVIAVFGPLPATTVLRQQVGRFAAWDPSIPDFVAPATGRYLIGVGSYGQFADGGVLTNGAVYSGAYALALSGVGVSQPAPTEPPVTTSGGATEPVVEAPVETPVEVPAAEPAPGVKQVAIDIMPGNKNYAPVNPKSNRKLSIAILSSAEFEPMNVDTESLTFGVQGNEQSLLNCDYTGKDLNRDGKVDRMCHFEAKLAGFKADSLEGTLRGKVVSADGDASDFEGHAYVRLVGTKK